MEPFVLDPDQPLTIAFDAAIGAAAGPGAAETLIAEFSSRLSAFLAAEIGPIRTLGDDGAALLSTPDFAGARMGVGVARLLGSGSITRWVVRFITTPGYRQLPATTQKRLTDLHAHAAALISAWSEVSAIEIHTGPSTVRGEPQ